ncbi:hypothetical protein AJ79_03104 [Helicocarpus griseus UAMH5409]|uniref:FAD-binding domain-containing protein n=1 Tax=Helicocarpus griseus UAMH5409 TaxID=1447875 RepID=A0A2B7Y094_9EURO|nr:hypothetical protein AJ79_03104 [Helicocarpus griseus UAMH5409]
MPPLHILIIGAGCAGPALAHNLSRSPHHAHRITIVERSPNLRASGAQIDLRSQGIEVVKRMGLHDEIRAKVVDEEGVAFVDANGKEVAVVGANKSGQGVQSFTTEWEIMRGDFVGVFYEATTKREGEGGKGKGKVEYIFGKSVEGFEEDGEGVLVRFDDGSSGRFDMVVGADGQGSRVRRIILPSSDSGSGSGSGSGELRRGRGSDHYLHLGFYIAYWFVPRIETDGNLARMHILPGGRMIMCRNHEGAETQVYFMLRDDSEELRDMPWASVEKQKEFWALRFRDADWQADRFIAGMKDTTNFYCQEVVQVKVDRWQQGRVVLLGDAASCPSPFSGMGTTGGLVGAYVLAGEIELNTDDVTRALENYEKIMRPYVDELQDIQPWLLKLATPKPRWGVAVVQFVLRVVCFLRIPDLIARFSSEEKGGWKLPDYPELNHSQGAEN